MYAHQSFSLSLSISIYLSIDRSLSISLATHTHTHIDAEKLRNVAVRSLECAHPSNTKPGGVVATKSAACVCLLNRQETHGASFKVLLLR